MATKVRSKKIFLNAIDERFANRKQVSIISTLSNGNEIISNTYGKYFTQDEIGSFDISKSGSVASLQFFPIDGRINEYTYSFLSYDTKQFASQSSETSLGDIVSIASTNVAISAGTTTIIKQIPLDYNSSKFIVELSSSNRFYEYTEINLVLGNSNEIFTSNFGTLCFDNDNQSVGLGTYSAEVSGSNINLYFHPDSSSIGNISANVVNVSLANTNFSSEGFSDLKYGKLESKKTSISSNPTPTATVVGSYDSLYQSSYIIAQVTDLTNNEVQITELFVLNNELDSYSVEYGGVQSNNELGTFSTRLSANTEILFTPNPNIDVEVVLFQNLLTYIQRAQFPPSIDLKNSEISTGSSKFNSDEKFRADFDLKYKGDFIFEKLFDGEASSIVNVNEDYIVIPNHFFVTGERVKYRSNNIDPDSTLNSIGIAATSIAGVGVTDKLSGELYIYKVDDTKIKFASSAEKALSTIPNLIDINSVGTGKTHYITSTNQDVKCIIAIDNVVQSPIVSTSTTSTLRNDISLVDTVLDFSNNIEFFSGDLFKIDDEIFKVESVGVGSTGFVEVQRNFLGSILNTHTSGSVITKLSGNYRIIGSRIYFASAPYGKVKTDLSSESGGIIVENEISSTFHGRVFIRSGVPDGTEETYKNNYLFDDISNTFDSSSKTFNITSGNQDISGISTDRSILLINNVLQIPEDDFTLSETLSSTTELNFTGSGTSISYDPNNASVPRGGIPISIGSSEGFGYQPLVSAGGTVIISSAGTVQSIIIGNGGSGYRSGIQTNIKVGVQTYSYGIPNIEFIGTATVQNGSINSITITNPGSGYTSSNPPDLVIDPPLSYSDIPLLYSSKYSPGIGTEAKIDIVVGQGSSVIDFVIKNYGYSYSVGDILTVDVGGNTGIPTDISKPFEEFSIIIDKVTKDNFSGWSVGNLLKLDNFSSKFNGLKKTFTLTLNGNIFTIISKSGSNIDTKATILVLLNDVIQIPNESYIFDGGNNITFLEPPNEDDNCEILFYRGTSGIDVVDVDIIETLKVGDSLDINGDDRNFDELSRLVENINSPTSVITNLYSSVGVSSNLEFFRPVNWCKQRNDLIIDDTNITKDRIEYLPNINPVAKLIKTIGIGDTNIFVDSVKTFFDYKNENPASIDFINKIEIIEDSEKTCAISTAVVSQSGTITSIDVVDGGSGYSQQPSVTIASPVTGVKATATANLSSGRVSSITINNPGSGYSNISPPLVIVESPTTKKEILNGVSYSGDFGIISAVNKVSVGYAVTGLQFDLVIPENSVLKDSRYLNPPISDNSSGIQSSYYFEVFNSNIGNGITSLDENGSIIGIGTSFIDNVYKVASISVGSTQAYGIGPVSLVKVVVSVSDYNGIGAGFSNFYGEYSWGLIETGSSTPQKEFLVNTDYGVVGLNSTPTIRRLNSLKNSGYTIT